MLDELGNYDPPFEFLWELAQKEQTPDSVWHACGPYKAALTTVDPSPWDKLEIPLTKDVRFRLWKKPGSNMIEGGLITLCILGGGLTTTESQKVTSRLARERFDRKMEYHCRRAIKFWGYPIFAGIDNDQFENGHAIWPTAKGFMAIAQSYLEGHEGHVGDELSIYLGYVEHPLPKMLTTFYDWRSKINKR